MEFSNLDREAIDYMKEKHVEHIFESLLKKLIVHRPEEPVAFIADQLRSFEVPKIIIAGAPASGKGTQCEQIVERYGVVHISTGDLLRAEVKKGSSVGKKAKTFMNKGKLVPDDIIISMVKDRIGMADCKARGWLLDGFPRTGEQANALQNLGIVPNKVILLDVPDAVIVERVVGRRLDPETGKIYHLKFNPPPKDVENRLTQRSDDTEEKAKERLKIYHENLQPLLDLYDRRVRRVDGNRERTLVFKELQAYLDE